MNIDILISVIVLAGFLVLVFRHFRYCPNFSREMTSFISGKQKTSGEGGETYSEGEIEGTLSYLGAEVCSGDEYFVEQ